MSVELTRKHMGIVARVVKRHYLTTTLDFDELVAAGMVGLVKAAQDYDAERGCEFTVYAWSRVRFAIQDHLRAVDHLSRDHRRLVRAGRVRDVPPPTSLETTIRLGPNGDRLVPDLVDPHDELDELEVRMVLEEAIDQLPDREQEAVRMRFHLHHTLADIALAFGVTESRVSQIITKALQRLRVLVGPDLLTA